VILKKRVLDITDSGSEEKITPPKKKPKTTKSDEKSSSSEEKTPKKRQHPYEVPLPRWKFHPRRKSSKKNKNNIWITPNGQVLRSKVAVNAYLEKTGATFRLPEGRVIFTGKRKSMKVIPSKKSQTLELEEDASVKKKINLRAISTEDLVDEDGWTTWTDIVFDIPVETEN